ncbi:Response regulator receiver domain-containing protein [Stigmatella aurantiaca]|uniref:Response regulator receiver domain-containing protein n=1 Tax=Stigmatella aurantiaca TaxID=41 RepID=A0A1H7K1N3_STIAU|nr:response regulator [Stigmatella aurantiaca]SEK80682.1 Response regulator receiver domain-containing protein [Stigmatella aurantiaca]
MSGDRLVSGSRVAVVGGGIAGAGLAASLMFNGRARGVSLEVRVYAQGEPDSVPPPVVLTPECRSRLAALGCRVPLDWRVHELRGVEVISDGRRELLPAPAGGLWVVDNWPHGPGGMSVVREALTTAATAQGARFISRRVDRVEHQPPSPDAPTPVRNSGPLVVRAQGSGERFHAVALATGTGSALAENFFPGFQPAPTVAAVHARVRQSASRLSLAPLARLWLSPLPTIDGLFLLPSAHSVYVLAFGPLVTPADLCQALMMAARDGLLEEGFELSALETTRLPFGPGRTLVAPGQLAVGPAAVGHPLQIGLSETLATCSRAAVGLLDGGLTPAALERRYVRNGLSEMMEDAAAGARSVAWLRRAGRRAPEAFLAARKRGAVGGVYSGGVLGLAAPTPLALLASARWAGLREVVGSWLRTTVEPVPTAMPSLEPDLYYVVDDDPDAREAMTQLLESTGATVVAFADELALFCAVARRPPTAILLDVVLHWVDGLRLCEGLKKHPLTRNTRVIVMSGLDRPHVRQGALDAGAEAFLPKPVEPRQLMQVLLGETLDAPRPALRPADVAAALESDRYAAS